MLQPSGQELKGRRGRTADPVRANRCLLLRAGETLSDRGRDRLRKSLTSMTRPANCRPRGSSKSSSAPCGAPDPSRTPAAKDRLGVLAERAAQPQTTRLWRIVCRWWKEIEVLIVTGATTAKVEAKQHRHQASERHGRRDHLDRGWSFMKAFGATGIGRRTGKKGSVGAKR
jgi:hypothetical protein